MQNAQLRAIETKKRILSAAGRSFRNHGYEKTTYQRLADELGISKAAIAYHFESKPWILYTLFDNYVQSIFEYVRIHLDGGINSYLYYSTAQIRFYREIMQDSRLWTLYYHKDHVSVWANERRIVIERYFREITSDFNKDFDEDEIHASAVMSLGAREGLFKEFLRCRDTMNVDMCCYYYVYLLGLLCRLDEATIQKNIRRAFTFVDSHTFPDAVLFG